MSLRLVTIEVDLLIDDDITPEDANQVLASLLRQEASSLRTSGIAHIGGGTIMRVKQAVR